MKQKLQKVWKVCGYGLGILLALLLLYAAAGWLIPYIGVNKDAAARGPDEMSIYIRSNGVHTDIVVPVRNEVTDWSRTILYDYTESKDSTLPWLAFGWGDKGFYLETPEWSDLKFSVAFRAMFHLGSSAMHVTFCRDMQTGERCREIRISYAEYRKLVAYLQDSFQYDAEGKVIPIPSHNDGYGRDDAFFVAKGVYDLFHTCNTWSNNALKACDQRACLWTPLDKGIFYQYRQEAAGR